MKGHRVSAPCMLLSLVLAATALWADSQVRIVRLSLVDGPVQLDRDTGRGFERAILNMPISNGMRLWTPDESRAEVEFEEGSVLRLAPGTKVDFTQLTLRDNGSRSTLITVDSGRVYVNYVHKGGEDFRIQLGNREIALTKSVQFRIDVNSANADLAVLKGDLLADGRKVKKNHTAVLSFSSGTYEIAKGIAPELTDDWNTDRNEYHDRFSRAGYRGAAFYGASDLDYYGSWYDTAYGNCWRPYGYSASWNPYSSGAWAWYPGYGYTWVSLYPWGWQPFRSGAWTYAGSGLGWCWSPSRTYYGYGLAPVYRAPYGFVKPHPPKRIVVLPPNRTVPPPNMRTAVVPRNLPNPDSDLVPVGDIDTLRWRLRKDPDAFAGPGGIRRGIPGVVGSSAATAPGRMAVTPRPHTDNGIPAWKPRDHQRDANRAAEQQMIRDAHRQATRVQHQMQRQVQMEMQRHDGPQRGFDRPASAPRMNAPAMRSAPPRTAAPSPAPRMSAPAPRMSAPEPRMSAPAAESHGSPRQAPPRQ